MESGDLQQLVREFPLMIRMNDGREFFVERPEFIVVADYAAAVLVHDNGTKRINHIALMNITSVVPNAPMPKGKRRRKTS